MLVFKCDWSDRWPGMQTMSETESVRFTLSAKTVKKMTKEELGYELSSNAFELLNQKAKENLMRGCGVEEVNDWIIGILSMFRDKDIVKRSDIEEAIDHLVDLEINIKKDMAADTKEEDDVKNADKIISAEIINESERIIDSENERVVDIVQLPSMGQIEDIKDLEEEVDRLKKIIQIILNKQAELV